MMSNKPKVLFFCAFPNQNRGFTGANIGNRVTYELIKEKCDIDIIDLGLKTFNPYEFGIIYLKYNLKIIAHFVQKWFLLWKQVRKKEYEYLYFLPASSPKGHLRDLFTVLIVHKKVKKIILHNRNGNFNEIGERKWHKSLTKTFIKKIHKFIFLSYELKAKCDTFIPQEKCTVIFNPIDKEIICTEDEVQHRIASRKPQKNLKILFLSNMIKSKGYLDLLNAGKILKDKYNVQNFTIDFIGRWNSKEDERFVNEFILKNNLSDNIKLHGKVTDRAKIKEYLLNADIFALPTYYPVEAQPRSIIESLNCGTPVVSTYHASIPEMIDDRKDGILVNQQDPEAIAAAILDISASPNWEKYACNAREKYNLKFSESVIKDKLLNVFCN